MFIIMSVFLKFFLQHCFSSTDAPCTFGMDFVLLLKYLFTPELCKETYIWPCCFFSVHTCHEGR